MSAFLTKIWNEEAEKMMMFLSEFEQKTNTCTYECSMTDEEIQNLLDEA